ncbi:MAG: WD40 repeat domain-containing protein, partial [Streptosporangiaceae bacterium]|nr:WD40 repeat domain-containing protein [Streptosporangiaceae bacterium]
ISRATLHGHIGGVRAVTFSPGGDLLATASYDFTAQIWDLASGATSIILEHDTPVQDVAFSPDGALLATAAADGTARIWDRATGTTRVILEGHSSRLEGVAFSPDGALLATASYDGTARIWDVTGRRTGRSFRRAVSPMKTLQGHAGGVLGVAFSPDGALLATSSSDGTARIWLVATGTGGAVLRGHNAPVRGVAFSPDGALLATASDDGTTRIWSVATGGARAILRVLPEGGYVALLPEGYKLNADPGDDLWWAIKLCRFAPGELDPYVPGLRRLPADAPIRLGAPLRLRLDLCVTPRLAEIIMPSAAVNFPRLPMKLGLGASLSRV